MYQFFKILEIHFTAQREMLLLYPEHIVKSWFGAATQPRVTAQHLVLLFGIVLNRELLVD
jgi:hypothetical protein